MGVAIVSAVVSVTGSLLTVMIPWLRERRRLEWVLKVVRQLPEDSVYIDDGTCVRIQVGSPRPSPHEETGDK
jgi:hypothetical protein